MRRWRRVDDDHSKALVAIVVVAQTCDFDNHLWQSLPDGLGANSDLIDCFKDCVANFAVAINPAPSARAWDVEAIGKFHEADASGDWVGIMNGWTQLREVPFFIANTLQTEAARFLNRYALNVLVQALANLVRIAPAMQIAGAFSVEERLKVAGFAASPHFEFAAAYKTVTERRNPRDRSEGLTASEQHLLSDLLIKVASDGPRWRAWMQVFNTYPGRFPLLQSALGAALAVAPDSAIESYVSAIWLYPSQPGSRMGQGTVDCLTEFRTKAPVERRKALWTAAHVRWLAWNFNAADPNQHMFWIGRCDLDFALVGYALECMSGAEREGTIQTIGKELLALDQKWYASQTDIITAWNRVLSRLQPYAWASTLSPDGSEWLADNRVCYPFDPQSDKYAVLKYAITT